MKASSFSPRHKALPARTQHGCLSATDKATSGETLQTCVPIGQFCGGPSGKPIIRFPEHSSAISYFPLVKLATKYHLQSAQTTPPNRPESTSLGFLRMPNENQKNLRLPHASASCPGNNTSSSGASFPRPPVTSTTSRPHKHNLNPLFGSHWSPKANNQRPFKNVALT